MNETADVVIVGGGVVGLSLAFHLARRRFGRIVLLEKDTLGSGSSGLSVAAIDLFTLLPAAAVLHARSHDWFTDFEERVGEPCGFVQTGFAAFGGEEHTAAIRTAVAVGQAAGIDVRLSSPAELSTLDPAAEVSDLALACYAPGGGHADPALTISAFASGARRMGVHIQQGREVVSLRRRGDQIIGVETPAGLIDAPIVVVAAGPWSGKLLHTVGYDPDLLVVRVPVASVRRPANFGPPHLSIIDLLNEIWARPESGDLTLVGSVDPEFGYDEILPDDEPWPVSSEYVFWSVERLVRRYPALELAEVRRGFSGVILAVSDRQPLLGRLPQAPGLYCATGLSGQGFKISPAVGDLMAGLIAGETDAAELLAPFRPTRFAEGEPLQTDFDTGTLG